MTAAGLSPAVRLAQGLAAAPAATLAANGQGMPLNAPTSSAERSAPATPAAAQGYDALEALLRAENLLAERGRTYDATFGEAPHEARERSMARTVAAFNALHGTRLTEAQGWSFMLCLKLVRLFCAPGFHADSADDAVAYTALLAEGKAGEGA